MLSRIEDWRAYLAAGLRTRERDLLRHHERHGPATGRRDLHRPPGGRVGPALEETQTRPTQENRRSAARGGTKGRARSIDKYRVPRTRPDRVLVPVGNKGLAVYQVGKNGDSKAKNCSIREVR